MSKKPNLRTSIGGGAGTVDHMKWTSRGLGLATLISLALIGGLVPIAQATPAFDVVATVTVETEPTSVALSADYAYVANQGDNSVSVIRRSDNTVTSRISLLPSGLGPRDIALSGGRAFVTNYGNNTVSVIDTTATPPVVTATISSVSNPFRNPLGIAVSGGFAYVTNYGEGTVSVIDTTLSTPVVTTKITVRPGPVGIAVSGGFAYVANNLNNSVSVIRLSDNTEVATITSVTSPQWLAISGGFAYVANGAANTVTIIRLSDNTKVGTIAVVGYPYGIAASGTYVYVTSLINNTLSVIDISSRTVVAGVIVGRSPFGVATAGERVYVANNLAASVSVIRAPADPVTPAAPANSGVASTVPAPWLQAYQRPGSDSTCLEGWSPSWAEWPGNGAGGFTCERTGVWSRDASAWVFSPGFRL
jgi:YVTN family beta-propeller protein